MKQTSITIFLFSLGMFFVLSCNDRPDGKSTAAGATLVDRLLPDSLFAFKNITSSLLTKHFKYDSTGECYYEDSSGKKNLVVLDSSQKKRYIGSMPVYTPEWIMNDWEVRFISKQNRIGSYTPIVLWAGGTDYSALILVTLDSACHPLSYLELSGGECGDAESYCDVHHSFFESGKIRSYVRRKIWAKDFSFTGYVDSVNYLSTMLSDGRFQTIKVDSARYKVSYGEDD